MFRGERRFKEYRISDVEEIDLSKYKLIIFSNPMLITKEKWNAYKAEYATVVSLCLLICRVFAPIRSLWMWKGCNLSNFVV